MSNPIWLDTDDQDSEAFARPRWWVGGVVALLVLFVLGGGWLYHYRSEQALILSNDIPATQWQAATVRSSDTLSSLFKQFGLSDKELIDVVSLKGGAALFSHLSPGQKIRVEIDEQGQLCQLFFEIDLRQTLHIEKVAGGYSAHIVRSQLAHHEKSVEGTIQHSLYGTAARVGVPAKIIAQFMKVFGWDVDFSREVQPGDQFKILYETRTLKGKTVEVGQIIAAELLRRGHILQAVEYPDQYGNPVYYSPDGKSLQRAFLRAPIHYKRISASFSTHRWHPILHLFRPHLGVDYAAPDGTRIRATGAGRIQFKGRKGGYGNVVVIDHGNHYTTLYAHMSKFEKHLKVGVHVKQGQLIGYVGHTGLATGPHVHYEFRIHGIHYDPQHVVLPKARSVSKKVLVAFKQHVAKVLARLEADV